MSERNWGKAIFGAVMGLILGVFLGIHRVTEGVIEEGGATGSVDFSLVIRSHRFWFPLIICTVAFAFISGRIGRPTSQSDL